MGAAIKDRGVALVAIVGRPNVGKSTLFNRIIGRRFAVVERVAGVTRDVVTATAQHNSRIFEVADTGGILDDVPADEILQKSQQMINRAADEADIILFVVDAEEGLHPLDNYIAERLRRKNKTVLLVANKVDNQQRQMELGEFHRLGFGEPIAVSAVHGTGVGELLDAVVEHLPETDAASLPTMKIAIVGKRNAGKSTLLNTLLMAERVIVSDTPGTTRDAVEVLVERGRHRFIAVDTAGLRRKGKIENSVELFSAMRTEAAIRAASVVLFLIDAAVPVSRVDKKIAHTITEAKRPVVLVVNKWDLAEGRATPRKYEKYLRAVLPSLDFAPIVFISALNDWNIDGLLDVAADLHRQANFRCSTGRLNRIIQSAVTKRPPPRLSAKKQGKVYYATQPETSPPTIVLFVNNPAWFTKEWLRYLENFLRDSLPFSEVPIKIELRKSEGRR